MHKKKGLLFFALILSIDALTKFWAYHSLPPLGWGGYPFGGVGIFSFQGVSFSLNYVANSGAAWGIFSGNAKVLFFFRIAMIAALFLFARKSFPLWLILTGAIGNAIDYLLYGYVVDFFHFSFWGASFPVFNIADACITLGAFFLLFPKRKKALAL